MDYSPFVHDRGTRFSNYSSIHSADAFVGEYQVAYTPGSTSPPVREKKRSTRFNRAASTSKHQNVSQSYVLPNNIPNTSQILPDQGSLPPVQIHYTVPADEKQIVASLRALQRDLNVAMDTIADLTRERDEALHEIKLLRSMSRKPSSPVKKREQAVRVEEEVFDLSRVQDSPKRPVARETAAKKVEIGVKTTNGTNTTDDARVISPVAAKRVSSHAAGKQPAIRFSSKALNERVSTKNVTTNETEQSMGMEDATAASNTSRRRRHQSLDENMTSAYILPDITMGNQNIPKQQVSKSAQSVLHSHDPQHIEGCDVCRRLTTKNQRRTTSKQDFTAQITELLKDVALEEPTMRPKIPPAEAFENVKRMLMEQFLEAKRKHNQAWEKYDAINAPLNSKKHGAASQDLFYWSKKMEECRIHLDQLRDVEEGLIAAGEM